MIQRMVDIGPIHASLPGPMKLSLGLYGDRIESAHAEFGWTKRNIEETAKGLDIYSAQLRLSRIAPEVGMVIDALYSETIEEMTGTTISERAEWIRDVAGRLCQLNLHFMYLAKVSRRLGMDILFHKLLKHRECILDLLELLTGSRFGFFYVVPGGVRYDLTEGFQERLESWVKVFGEDYPRILALLCWTHGFHNRLKSMGRILDDGQQGFVSRSSVEVSVLGSVSSVESRMMSSLKFCKDSADYLDQCLNEKKAVGGLKTPLGKLNQDVGQNTIETIRGVWTLSTKISPEMKIKSLKMGTPSEVIKENIVTALDGESLEDLPLILESLFLIVGEVDR